MGSKCAIFHLIDIQIQNERIQWMSHSRCSRCCVAGTGCDVNAVPWFWLSLFFSLVQCFFLLAVVLLLIAQSPHTTLHDDRSSSRSAVTSCALIQHPHTHTRTKHIWFVHRDMLHMHVIVFCCWYDWHHIECCSAGFCAKKCFDFFLIRPLARCCLLSSIDYLHSAPFCLACRWLHKWIGLGRRLDIDSIDTLV